MSELDLHKKDLDPPNENFKMVELSEHGDLNNDIELAIPDPNAWRDQFRGLKSGTYRLVMPWGTIKAPFTKEHLITPDSHKAFSSPHASIQLIHGPDKGRWIHVKVRLTETEVNFVSNAISWVWSDFAHSSPPKKRIFSMSGRSPESKPSYSIPKKAWKFIGPPEAPYPITPSTAAPFAGPRTVIWITGQYFAGWCLHIPRLLTSKEIDIASSNLHERIRWSWNWGDGKTPEIDESIAPSMSPETKAFFQQQTKIMKILEKFVFLDFGAQELDPSDTPSGALPIWKLRPGEEDCYTERSSSEDDHMSIRYAEVDSEEEDENRATAMRHSGWLYERERKGLIKEENGWYKKRLYHDPQSRRYSGSTASSNVDEIDDGGPWLTRPRFGSQRQATSDSDQNGPNEESSLNGSSQERITIGDVDSELLESNGNIMFPTPDATGKFASTPRSSSEESIGKINVIEEPSVETVRSVAQAVQQNDSHELGAALKGEAGKLQVTPIAVLGQPPVWIEKPTGSGGVDLASNQTNTELKKVPSEELQDDIIDTASAGDLETDPDEEAKEKLLFDPTMFSPKELAVHDNLSQKINRWSGTTLMGSVLRHDEVRPPKVENTSSLPKSNPTLDHQSKGHKVTEDRSEGLTCTGEEVILGAPVAETRMENTPIVQSAAEDDYSNQPHDEPHYQIPDTLLQPAELADLPATGVNQDRGILSEEYRAIAAKAQSDHDQHAENVWSIECTREVPDGTLSKQELETLGQGPAEIRTHVDEQEHEPADYGKLVALTGTTVALGATVYRLVHKIPVYESSEMALEARVRVLGVTLTTKEVFEIVIDDISAHYPYLAYVLEKPQQGAVVWGASHVAVVWLQTRVFWPWPCIIKPVSKVVFRVVGFVVMLPIGAVLCVVRLPQTLLVSMVFLARTSGNIMLSMCAYLGARVVFTWQDHDYATISMPTPHLSGLFMVDEKYVLVGLALFSVWVWFYGLARFGHNVEEYQRWCRRVESLVRLILLSLSLYLAYMHSELRGYTIMKG